MVKSFWHLVPLTVPMVAMVLQAQAFSFAGLSLGSDLNQVATRYPHSDRVGSYIHVAPNDSHDHISGIEISGAGATRRVRVSFESRRQGQQPEYPTCAHVQAKLEKRFGPPSSIRRFAEEASRRADRLWRSRTEVLTLICFGGSRGQWLAEAVQINRRDTARP